MPHFVYVVALFFSLASAVHLDEFMENFTQALGAIRNGTESYYANVRPVLDMLYKTPDTLAEVNMRREVFQVYDHYISKKLMAASQLINMISNQVPPINTTPSDDFNFHDDISDFPINDTNDSTYFLFPHRVNENHTSVLYPHLSNCSSLDIALLSATSVLRYDTLSEMRYISLYSDMKDAEFPTFGEEVFLIGDNGDTRAYPYMHFYDQYDGRMSVAYRSQYYTLRGTYLDILIDASLFAGSQLRLFARAIAMTILMSVSPSQLVRVFFIGGIVKPFYVGYVSNIDIVRLADRDIALGTYVTTAFLNKYMNTTAQTSAIYFILGGFFMVNTVQEFVRPCHSPTVKILLTTDLTTVRPVETFLRPEDTGFKELEFKSRLVNTRSQLLTRLPLWTKYIAKIYDATIYDMYICQRRCMLFCGDCDLRSILEQALSFLQRRQLLITQGAVTSSFVGRDPNPFISYPIIRNGTMVAVLAISLHLSSIYTEYISRLPVLRDIDLFMFSGQRVIWLLDDYNQVTRKASALRGIRPNVYDNRMFRESMRHCLINDLIQVHMYLTHTSSLASIFVHNVSASLLIQAKHDNDISDVVNERGYCHGESGTFTQDMLAYNVYYSSDKNMISVDSPTYTSVDSSLLKGQSTINRSYIWCLLSYVCDTYLFILIPPSSSAATYPVRNYLLSINILALRKTEHLIYQGKTDEDVAALFENLTYTLPMDHYFIKVGGDRVLSANYLSLLPDAKVSMQKALHRLIDREHPTSEPISNGAALFLPSLSYSIFRAHRLILYKVLSSINAINFTANTIAFSDDSLLHTAVDSSWIESTIMCNTNCNKNSLIGIPLLTKRRLYTHSAFTVAYDNDERYYSNDVSTLTSNVVKAEGNFHDSSQCFISPFTQDHNSARLTGRTPFITDWVLYSRANNNHMYVDIASSVLGIVGVALQAEYSFRINTRMLYVNAMKQIKTLGCTDSACKLFILNKNAQVLVSPSSGAGRHKTYTRIPRSRGNATEDVCLVPTYNPYIITQLFLAGFLELHPRVCNRNVCMVYNIVGIEEGELLNVPVGYYHKTQLENQFIIAYAKSIYEFLVNNGTPQSSVPDIFMLSKKANMFLDNRTHLFIYRIGDVFILLAVNSQAISIVQEHAVRCYADTNEYWTAVTRFIGFYEMTYEYVNPISDAHVDKMLSDDIPSLSVHPVEVSTVIVADLKYWNVLLFYIYFAMVIFLLVALGFHVLHTYCLPSETFFGLQLYWELFK